MRQVKEAIPGKKYKETNMEIEALIFDMSCRNELSMLFIVVSRFLFQLILLWLTWRTL